MQWIKKLLKTQNSADYRQKNIIYKKKKPMWLLYLIHINQCNTDKQNLQNKIGEVDKKYQTLLV